MMHDDPNALVLDFSVVVYMAEFRPFWPTDVDKIAQRFALWLREGPSNATELPPYAVKELTWALKQIRRVEDQRAAELDSPAVKHYVGKNKSHRKMRSA